MVLSCACPIDFTELRHHDIKKKEKIFRVFRDSDFEGVGDSGAVKRRPQASLQGPPLGGATPSCEQRGLLH